LGLTKVAMEVGFRTRQLAKVCTDHRARQRTFGAERAKKILLRLNQMTAAASLGELMTLPQARCHPRTVGSGEQFTVDLDGPYRLLFEVADEPVPELSDGGVAVDLVHRVTVIEVTDPH